MIPKRLVIDGLYSFKNRQEIVFDELLDSHLFGIFGPVGAGKSTILDAMSLTLFGEVDRMNRQDSRAYNLLNLSRDDCFVEFEFEVNDALYKATVIVKRKPTGQPSFTRKAFAFTNKWEAMETQAIPNIIGLDYENFRRAMIIPQGKFQEFLKLGDKDRINMLKTLFQLEKYDLFESTSKLFSENHHAFLETQAKLSQVPEATTQSRLDALASTIKTLEKDILKAKEILASSQTQLHTLNEAEKAQKAFEKNIIELKQLDAQRQGIEGKASQLKTYVNFKLAFQALILDIDSATKEQSSATAQLSKLQQSKTLLIPKLKALEEAEKTNQHDLATIPILESKIKELSLKKKLEPLTIELNDVSGKLLDMEKKSQVQTKHQDELSQGIEKTKSMLEKTQKQLTETQASATRDEWLTELANHVHVGRPCPLCKQEVKEFKESAHFQTSLLETTASKPAAQTVSDLMAPTASASMTLKNELSKSKPFQTNLSALKASIKEQEKSLIEKNNSLEKVRQSLESLNKDIQLLSTKKANIEGQRNALNAEIFALTGQQVTTPEGPPETVSNTRPSETAANSGHFQTAAISGQSNISAPDRPAGIATSTLTDPSKIAAHIQSIQTQASQIANQKLQLERDQQDTKTRLELLESQLKNLQNRLEKNNKQLAELLKKHNVSKTEVSNVLSLHLDVEKIEAETKAFNEKLQRIQHHQSQLSALLQQAPYDQKQHEKIKHDVKQFSLQVEFKSQEKGRAEGELKTCTAWIEKKKLYKADLEKLEKRKHNLTILKDLFSGQKFVNFVSTQFLKQLCEQGNKRFFKMTQKKLKLAINLQNQFCVIDYLNGGKQRSIGSLSGGQLFQASLCLALALSETIKASLKYKQNFFFIDEGFGSLDQAAIQDVVETLFQLRSENQTIGVISHVESLKQDVPVFLHVANSANQGSKITTSWD